MDPLTHAALGATCAQAAFGRYNKQIPWKAGALAAMAPDLDIFLRFSDDPLSLEFWHRNFTHSLIFIPIGGVIVGLFLMCFPHFRNQWKITLGAAIVGYATHGLLDACTTYGTLLLWPWSNTRISWDLVAIIDPLVTTPLILGAAWSVINKSQKGVYLALLFTGFFFVFNTVQHHRALLNAQEYAQQQKLPLTHIRAMPEIASSTNWRIIARDNNCFLLAHTYTPIWGEDTVTALGRTIRFSQSLLSFKLSPEQKNEVATFSWFSDDYLILANKDPLILTNGLFTMGVNPMFSLWGIKVLPNQKHIIPAGQVVIKDFCE